MGIRRSLARTAWHKTLTASGPCLTAGTPYCRFFSSEAIDSRERLDYDVCIVGGGPAGLAAALRLKFGAKNTGNDISVAILEKGANVGSHILSGCVLNTRAIDALIPNWKQDPSCPIKQPVTNYQLKYLTRSGAFKLPHVPVGECYLVSLGQVCSWMAAEAESAGVDVYTGMAATQLLTDADNYVKGVRLSDHGIDKQGNKKQDYVQGSDVQAKAVLLADGCHGNLSQIAIQLHRLREGKSFSPQTYGLGIKEVWKVPSKPEMAGSVLHTIGWPLNSKAYGGGFLYWIDDQTVALGLVTGLDYTDSNINPFDEMQRWKQHIEINQHLKGGEPIEYGAKCINEGGWQSIPRLEFPGGALIGCSAGFVHVPKLQGVHYAMTSGVIAADQITRYREYFGVESEKYELLGYQSLLFNSWVGDELYRARNIRPAFKFGMIPGLIISAVELFWSKGAAPFSISNKKCDHERLNQIPKGPSAEQLTSKSTIKHDYSISKDYALYLSGTNHDHDQPPHLKVQDYTVQEKSVRLYGAPETEYCPAGVYEYVQSDDQQSPTLRINAQNCLHCKACDIKEPHQNIKWTPPQGGEGPAYKNM